MAEAAYRLIPSLHVKMSNVLTKFVQTGFPQNRTCIAQKVRDEPDPEPEGEIFEEQQPNVGRETFSIEGREGTYTQPVSIHEKYHMRPKALDNMNLAQFATSYEPVTKKQINEEAIFENDKDFSNNTGPLENHITGKELPKYIRLLDGSAMKLRTFPMILRLHASKNKATPHERIYAELLLFWPWRDEEKLHPDDEDKCRKLYNEHKELIDAYRKKIYPFSKASDALKRLMENTDIQRPALIPDAIGLDAAGEQDNLECEDEMPPLDRSELPPEVDNQPTTNQNASSYQEATKAKRIDAEDIEAMINDCRSLSYEQKVVLNKIVHFCKALLIAKNYPHAEFPEPPRLIVTGKH